MHSGTALWQERLEVKAQLERHQEDLRVMLVRMIEEHRTRRADILNGGSGRAPDRKWLLPDRSATTERRRTAELTGSSATMSGVAPPTHSSAMSTGVIPRPELTLASARGGLGVTAAERLYGTRVPTELLKDVPAAPLRKRPFLAGSAGLTLPLFTQGQLVEEVGRDDVTELAGRLRALTAASTNTTDSTARSTSGGVQARGDAESERLPWGAGSGRQPKASAQSGLLRLPSQRHNWSSRDEGGGWLRGVRASALPAAAASTAATKVHQSTGGAASATASGAGPSAATAAGVASPGAEAAADDAHEAAAPAHAQTPAERQAAHVAHTARVDARRATQAQARGAADLVLAIKAQMQRKAAAEAAVRAQFNVDAYRGLLARQVQEQGQLEGQRTVRASTLRVLQAELREHDKHEMLRRGSEAQARAALARDEARSAAAIRERAQAVRRVQRQLVMALDSADFLADVQVTNNRGALPRRRLWQLLSTRLRLCVFSLPSRTPHFASCHRLVRLQAPRCCSRTCSATCRPQPQPRASTSPASCGHLRPSSPGWTPARSSCWMRRAVVGAGMWVWRRN